MYSPSHPSGDEILEVGDDDPELPVELVWVPHREGRVLGQVGEDRDGGDEAERALVLRGEVDCTGNKRGGISCQFEVSP